jgi:hypothetical protein
MFTITSLILIVISESFCFFLIYSILSTLRRNSATFSRNTYKLHWQLTLLLAAQVTKTYAVQLINALLDCNTAVTSCYSRLGTFSQRRFGKQCIDKSHTRRYSNWIYFSYILRIVQFHSNNCICGSIPNSCLQFFDLSVATTNLLHFWNVSFGASTKIYIMDLFNKLQP